MCVIIAKPAGADLPTKSDLQLCWKANPDGAGFAVATGTNVIIHKGYRNFQSFYRHLRRHCPTSQSAIIHFRLGTSGAKDSAMCHPFPITPDPTLLRKTTVKCPIAVAHNGIFGPGEADLSDTAIFVRDTLAPLLGSLRSPDDLVSKPVLSLIEMAIDGDRLAFLTPDGFTLVGNWQNLAPLGSATQISSHKPRHSSLTLGPSDDCLYSNFHWLGLLNLAPLSSGTRISSPNHQTPNPKSQPSDLDWEWEWNWDGQDDTIGFCPNCYHPITSNDLLD